jgi:hypothetical protein
MSQQLGPGTVYGHKYHWNFKKHSHLMLQEDVEAEQQTQAYLTYTNTECSTDSSDVRNEGRVASTEANLAFFLLDFNADKTLSLRTMYWKDEKTPLAPTTWLEVL